MARQIVQVNVVQDGSGGSVRVTLSWTSDGFMVKTAKFYLRQPGGYTMDAGLFARLEESVLEAVRTVLTYEQLF